MTDIRFRLFLVSLALGGLSLAGCATDTGRVDSLEARVSSLERKSEGGTAREMTEEAPTATLTESAATMETTPEATVPDSPSKEEIQAALKKAGYYDGSVDGKIGPQTRKAIEDFQTAHDLIPDGKVGPNTWTKLKEFYVPVASITTTTVD